MIEQENMIRKQFVRTAVVLSLLNFMIVGIIGTINRFYFVEPMVDYPYRNWLHAHSHIGFLGWVFIALALAILQTAINQDEENERFYLKMLIWLILVEVSIGGMLLTFPGAGYAFGSITYSTMHMILSFYFMWVIYKQGSTYTGVVPRKFFLAGFIFMILSAAGPLLLANFASKGMEDSQWYEMSVYYYLHFQYNGWFVLAIIGLFYYILDKAGISYSQNSANLILKLLLISVFLTYPLSILHLEIPGWIRWVGVVGILAQLAAVGMLLNFAYSNKGALWSQLQSWVTILIGVSLVAWAVKSVLQLASAIPALQQMAFGERDIVIIYLHLSLIGFISIFIIGYFIYQKWLTQRKVVNGVIMLFLGFLITEILILLRTLINYESEQVELMNIAIVFFSAIIVLGISVLLFSRKRGLS